MARPTATLLLMLALTVCCKASAPEEFPWKFGMSAAQVDGVSEFQPYRRFGNGDLETYKGLYDGKEENFQFFFGDKGLTRIGIYLYEGTDLEAAGAVWLRLYDSLVRRHGNVETLDGLAPAAGDPTQRGLFVASAIRAVASGDKRKMAPFSQPSDHKEFSSFDVQDVQGTKYYYVVLYVDGRP